jgi:plastocyanin
VFPSLRRAATALAVAALLMTALAACSTGSNAGAGSSPVATTTVDLPPSYKFVPASAAVHPGDTVTWTNHDNFTHSVHFLDGGLPGDPLVMQPGQSVTFTFATAGRFTYECHFHPQNMKGSVTVAP